ncbi:hypothetical protein GCM10022243_13490 [Saccharothrix violaceirubra]
MEIRSTSCRIDSYRAAFSSASRSQSSTKRCTPASGSVIGSPSGDMDRAKVLRRRRRIERIRSQDDRIGPIVEGRRAHSGQPQGCAGYLLWHDLPGSTCDDFGGRKPGGGGYIGWAGHAAAPHAQQIRTEP